MSPFSSVRLHANLLIIVDLAHIPFKFIRLALALVGFVFLGLAFIPDLFGIPAWESWTTTRVVQLLVGVNMLLVAVLLLVRSLQIWLLRTVAERMLPPMEIALLILTRVGLAVAGITITAVVLSADFLGLDQTEGYGPLRTFQLVAGILLLVAAFLLHNKPTQKWFIHFFGEAALESTQSVMMSFTRLVLYVAGLVTIFIALASDLVGLDSTPGWGHHRTIQLFVGISMLIAGSILNYRPIQIWFLRNIGFRMLTPTQVVLLLVAQVGLAVAGITVILLVVFADPLGIDHTPGWGETRYKQLIAGCVLLLGSMVLYSRPLLNLLRR